MSSPKKIPVKYKRMIDEAFENGMKHVQKVLLTSLMKKNDWNQSKLAKFLGITGPAVSGILKKGRKQQASLENMMQRIEDGFILQTLNSIYSPICELEEIKVGCNQIEFIRENNKVAKSLEKLQETNGIYIFYDSVGKAIYAGRAVDQTLFTEMNQVLARDRSEQTVRRCVGGKMMKTKYNIRDAAHYVSAYDVRSELIPSFEALIIRAFPNDLTNVRMERHKQIEKLTKNTD